MNLTVFIIPIKDIPFLSPGVRYPGARVGITLIGLVPP